MSKEQYNLHLANPPKPVRLAHPVTGQEVGSWSYLVSHKNTGLFGKVELNEVFDFASRQILTLDKEGENIQKIEAFDDPARNADVDRAFQWLSSNHRNWYF